MWVRVSPFSSWPCWSRIRPLSWSRSCRPSDLANSSSILVSPAVFTALTVTAKVASLPGQILRRIIGRERHLHFALVAGLGADQLVLEARDQPARAELDRHVLALAALERLAADLALEIHDDEVAGRGCMLLGRVVPALALAGELLRSARRPRFSSGSTVSRSSFSSSICGVGTSGSASSLDRDLGVLAGLILLVELDLRLQRGTDLLLGQQLLDASWTAPSSASPRSASPCILRMRLGGTLPGRKPGIRTCGAIRFTSCSTRASMSLAGMVSMKARLRPSFSVSTVLMVTLSKIPMNVLMASAAAAEMVRAEGLEPPHLSTLDLNPARLPIPPRARTP